MKPGTRLRRWILFAALAATVVAAGWVGGQEEVTVSPVERETEPAPRRATLAATSVAPAGVDLEKLRQRSVSRDFGDISHNFGNIFPDRSWRPPSPPPAKPPPRAPPLPFTFFGRMVEDGRTVVFLAQKDQTFTVKAGETVAGNYRVEEIGPANVVFTYLPLKELQTLNIGQIQ